MAVDAAGKRNGSQGARERRGKAFTPHVQSYTVGLRWAIVSDRLQRQMQQNFLARLVREPRERRRARRSGQYCANHRAREFNSATTRTHVIAEIIDDDRNPRQRLRLEG